MQPLRCSAIPKLAIILAMTQPMVRRMCRIVVIDLLGRIGEEKGATLAQIAIAWLLAQRPWIGPIPGSRKLERLDENIGALAVELRPDDLREIKSALSTITVQGDRYPKNLQKMTGR
jgi:aryl-alcohol dehydrogenase-like predicted oxidoreductase